MPADPYSDPRTGVMFNVLGIHDAAQLARVELALATARDAELVRWPEPGMYDLAHLRRIHRRLFGDVYVWAGELRTVAIARTTLFALPQFIEPQAQKIFVGLAGEDHLQGLDEEQFVDRLAYFVAEVNALHPFRDGNGRALRAFFRQLAADAGWRTDWTGVTRKQNDEASRLSLAGDLTALRELLRHVLRPC